MVKIKRLGVISFGKFFAIIGFFQGIVTIITYLILSSVINGVLAEIGHRFVEISSATTHVALPSVIHLLPTLNVFWAIAIVLASAIIGFFIGILIALSFNSTSKLIGGLEMEIE